MEVAVISGKGGTGKSSIAAALASLHQDVVLADCDVDAANLYLLFHPEIDSEEAFVGSSKAFIQRGLCTDCGICNQYCRFDAITELEGHFYISETLCDGCYLCSRVCPENAIVMTKNDKSRIYSGTFRHGGMVYGWLAPGEENSGKMVSRIREMARKMAAKGPPREIILDGPPGIGCAVISTITGVDVVLIVTEPSLSAISDLKRTIGMVGGFDIPVAVLINKSDLNLDLRDAIQSYCDNMTIPVVARLSFDPKIVEAMVNCSSIVEWDPESHSSKEINRAWDGLKMLTEKDSRRI